MVTWPPPPPPPPWPPPPPPALTSVRICSTSWLSRKRTKKGRSEERRVGTHDASAPADAGPSGVLTTSAGAEYSRHLSPRCKAASLRGRRETGHDVASENERAASGAFRALARGRKRLARVWRVSLAGLAFVVVRRVLHGHVAAATTTAAVAAAAAAGLDIRADLQHFLALEEAHEEG